MHGPEILVPLGFFATVVTIAVGVPLARALAQRMGRAAPHPSLPADAANRLERIEQTLDTLAVEIERISEGQRFVTKLLSERGPGHAVLGRGAASDV